MPAVYANVNAQLGAPSTCCLGRAKLRRVNAPTGPTGRTPVILTDAQYEAMARRGAFVGLGRVELRGGVVVAMSPVHLNHSTVCTALLVAGHQALKGGGSGLRANVEITIRFGGGFSPTADIVIWDPASVPAVDGPIPAEAVKLVIEVVDASLPDDLGQKLVDYAQAGLAEYWVADATARVIHICTDPQPHGFARRRVVRFGEPAEAESLALKIDTAGM